MRGRKKSFCACVPYFMITGPHRVRPMEGRDGVPTRAHSIEKISRCRALQPGPPYCFGQLGAIQPLS